ncbi:MAG: hypothetical protein J6T72_00115 [Alphaproteobacteria bacterium]|nr:hypothetical protein [Alphaproteobacteria bacterium]
MINKYKQFASQTENTVTPVIGGGFLYRNVFSPSISLDDFPKRMEKRIQKVRKMVKNNIFIHPYKSDNA